MPKFPEPPGQSRLAAIHPATAILARGALLWRLYFAEGPYPAAGWNAFRFYGPTLARFDHQEPPPRVGPRGILYAARSWHTCFGEVFQDTRTIDRHRHAPVLVAFDLVRDVALLDLRGAWPTRAGASSAIGSGPRARARRWSRQIYEAYPAMEGLYYASSMDGGRDAVALYERAQGALAARPRFHRLLSDPLLFSTVSAAAGRFGYALV
jgi:hypothetical protein